MLSNKLLVSNMQNTKTIRMLCVYCQKLPKNHQEAMELNYFGYHLSCEHAMADVNDQGKAENEIQN